jgi:hypothetical protein
MELISSMNENLIAKFLENRATSYKTMKVTELYFNAALRSCIAIITNGIGCKTDWVYIL